MIVESLLNPSHQQLVVTAQISRLDLVNLSEISGPLQQVPGP